MTRRPIQHEISERSERLFRQSLPPSWVVRAQIPDYGIDFQVEMFNEGLSTGIVFEVQLKGSQRNCNNATGPALQMETSALLHYVQRRIVPVVLVYVDVKNDRVFWAMAVDQVLLLSLERPGWHLQETVSIRFSKKKTLPDSIDQLSSQATAMADRNRAFSRDSGMLIFDGIDDFIYGHIEKFSALKNVSLSTTLKPFPTHGVRGTIWSICEQAQANVSNNAQFRFKSKVSLFAEFLGDKLVLTLKGQSFSLESVFPNSDVDLDHFFTVTAEFSDTLFKITVGSESRIHARPTNITAGPFLLIAAEGGAQLVRNNVPMYLVDVTGFDQYDCKSIFHWIFPQIDPGLDLTGNLVRARFPGIDGFSQAQRPWRVPITDPQYLDSILS